MKKVTRKVKQALSILLVAAMVITMVPQNTLSVSAEEAVETVTETEAVETTVTAETEETTSETENVDETGASDEDADAEESEEGEADEETDETDTEETADEETEATEDEESEEGIKKGALGAEVMADSSYTVTVENKDSINATVAYTNNCVTGENAIEENMDLTFTVTPADDYKVTGVKYTVGSGEEQEPSYDSGTGVYTIAKEKITGNVTIKVTTVALANYTITFDVAEGATVKITGESAKDITKDSPSKNVIVKENASISFTVDVASGYTLDDVTATDKTGELTNVEGTYTFAPTSASTITIETKEKTQAKQEVSFDYDDAKLVVKQVVTAEEGEELAAINGKKLEVAEGEKLAFAVAAVKDSKYKPMDAVITPTDSEEEVPCTKATKKFDEVDYTVYTVTAVNEALTVKIDNELDPDKANVLTLAVDGNAGKVTVLVDGEEIANGEKALTAEGSCKVKVTADTGYAVTKVELIDKDMKSLIRMVISLQRTADFTAW